MILERLSRHEYWQALDLDFESVESSGALLDIMDRFDSQLVLLLLT